MSHRLRAASRRTPAPLAHARLRAACRRTVEPLERRALLSVTLDGAQLRIVGTGGNDAYTLTRSGNVLTVTENGTPRTFDATRVGGITAGLAGGNDAIALDAAVAIPATLSGEAGDDTLAGSAASDSLDGGSGTDTVSYASRTTPVAAQLVVTFSRPMFGDDTFTVGGGGGVSGETDAYDGVETLTGGDGDDVLGIQVARFGSNQPRNAPPLDLLINGAGGADDLWIAGLYDVTTFAPAMVLGNLTADGGDGDDALSASDLRNGLLIGGAGDDTFANGADDTSFGVVPGAGFDTFTYTANSGMGGYTMPDDLEKFVAGSSIRSVTGNDSDNVIVAAGGNEGVTVDGGGGNDEITVLLGSGQVDGGAGDDTLVGGAVTDTLVGGAGDDTFRNAASAVPNIVAGAGVDLFEFATDGNTRTTPYAMPEGLENLTLNGLGGTVNGNALPNVIRSIVPGATLNGGAGNDTLTGSASITGGTRITGGDGDDVIRGSGGNDRLSGDAGDDKVNGLNGLDTVYGGAGDDTLSGDGGRDLLRGEAGNDVLYGNASNDWLYGNAGNDRLYGGTGNDDLNGDAGNDSFYGNEGDDTLDGGEGSDAFDGGTGRDWLVGGTGRDRARRDSADIVMQIEELK